MSRVMIITGTRKGIGRGLVDHYLARGYIVAGCSRGPLDDAPEGYHHTCLDVSDEEAVQAMVREVAAELGPIDVLINNAGVASMNHVLLTPGTTVRNVLETNVLGSFLFSREVAKVMSRRKRGRIVNMATVATPLKLEGEAIYAASKAAVESLTAVMARELAPMNITVNAVGPTPVDTDLILGVDREKIEALVQLQAIKRKGELRDIANVIDFFIDEASDFVTGQVLFLGGVS
jgi:3-oxoacyl-[acyl-carrier protein] reductase